MGLCAVRENIPQLSANIAGHSGGGATTADDDDDDDEDDAVIAAVSREEPPPAGARYSTPSDEDRPEAPGTSIIPSRAVDHRWSLWWSTTREIANDDDFIRRRPMRTSAAAALPPPGWPESSGGEEEDPATMPPVDEEVQAAVAFADPARRWGRMVNAITMERGRVGILLFSQGYFENENTTSRISTMDILCPYRGALKC